MAVATGIMGIWPSFMKRLEFGLPFFWAERAFCKLFFQLGSRLELHCHSLWRARTKADVVTSLVAAADVLVRFWSGVWCGSVLFDHFLRVLFLTGLLADWWMVDPKRAEEQVSPAIRRIAR